MDEFGFRKKLRFVPEFDKDFFPMSVGNLAYREKLSRTDAVPVVIALERSGGLVSVFQTEVFETGHEQDNMIYVERLLKTLLWLKGGCKVHYCGPAYIAEYLKDQYRSGGKREFDAAFMEKIFGMDFEIILADLEAIPKEKENPKAVGGHFKGCRIGFDAGGSDRKVSAVVDGETIFSEEVVWNPKLAEDPQYQYEGIMDSLKSAASKMERVDAIGVSAAGIYIDNEVRAASLFIKVPQDLFEKKVRRMFLDIADEMGGVPIEVANDGDVTALAGAMSLGENNILGIAMGTSEAGGYIDGDGLITGWLNELAFVPIDYSRNAMEDEWAGDTGCGVKYFSQDGVIKLADNAGIVFEDGLSPAEKLKVIQEMMSENDDRAYKIYESMGYYLGYAVAYYADFYDIGRVLLMGRVTSGSGGEIMTRCAMDVLKEEFPKLHKKVVISLPDEKSRRVGQSVAAASLPMIGDAL